jgi:hypothetical protein
MTLTKTIVNMNNHAVDLLRTGRYDEAMTDLRKVVLVLADVSCQNSGTLLVQQERQLYASLQPPQQAAPWDIFVTTSPAACSIDGLGEGSGVLSIEYAFLPNLPRRGHHHHHHNDHHMLVSDNENAACTAVCVYNMALCCYCEWLQTTQGNNDHFGLLQQAIDLYDQALGIILTWKPIISDSSFSLFIMALCKNVITIFHDVGDLVRVKSWRTSWSKPLVLWT